MNNLEPIRTLFAKNRTEELGNDVYQHFVIPPFFDRLDLQAARKPRLFIGGRGCGKTMLLRYLSHQSAFSTSRQSIPRHALEHIGLYWRVDTQFAAVMHQRGIAEDVWSSAFNHLLGIVLGLEVLRSLKNIESSAIQVLQPGQIEEVSFDRLKVYDESFSGGTSNLIFSLEQRLAELEMWVANVRKRAEPVFLPGRSFVLSLIRHITQAIPALKSAAFFVYVDEFENLLHYQQRILNTCIKHSEIPLIFNIAMKRHAFETLHTVGSEAIQDIADYRKHDLEAYLDEGEFDVFAAEVLFLSLAQAGVVDVPISAATLRNPDGLSNRREKPYRDRIRGRVRQMLPGRKHDDVAADVFKIDSLRRKLRERVRRALEERASKIEVDRLFRPDFPQATIVVTALLHRRRLEVEEIAREMDNLSQGATSKFTDGPGWIHNNLVGCLLWLYDSHPSVCPLFAGFDTFCLLARGNMRHFLEFCHTSFNQNSNPLVESEVVVTVDHQAKAARQASAAFLNEISAFGRQGDRLHTFVLRLGSLFALAHRRPSQSEPEQSHFAIVRGTRPFSEDMLCFLKEAEKWSVLFLEEETKVKSVTQFVSGDYVLNPVYSPYFNITFRKKRKVELSTDDLEVLVMGGLEEVSQLLRRFSKQWDVKSGPGEGWLFAFETEVAS